MSVLGQKVTRLSQINYIQPGDTFLAIRGGVSYKVFGDRIASVEQLNATKEDYTLKINNLENTVSNRLAGIDIRLNNISDTMFLRTAGEALNTAVFALSAEVFELKSTTARLSYVDAVSSNIVNWTSSTFLNKLDTENGYLPFPGPNLYSSNDGSVLTWNSNTSAWVAGPGLSVLTKVDISPIGTIILYAGTNPPPGYLECNGQFVAKVDYPELWNAITDTYGRPGYLSDALFQIPNLSGMEILAANAEAYANEGFLFPISFYIKSLNVGPTSATPVLSSYLKISTQYVPSNGQYLKYSGGEWVPSAITSTTSLPSAASIGSLLTWNGSDWAAGSPNIQSTYEHNSIVAYENTECVFTDIPFSAMKITLVISDLDISAGNGTYVKLKLGTRQNFINSGYNNSCQGTFANPYQRTSGGYYSYITNSALPTDAAYLLVRLDDFITKNEIGGLDAIVTLMRSYKSLLTSDSKWVYTHTGHVGATVIHGSGSVMLNNPSPDTIGIFPPNPSSVITRGQMTLYWE